MTRRLLASALPLVAVAIALAPIPSLAQRARGVVSGTVFDSIAKKRLTGARVQLVSTHRSSFERSILADQNGRFRFDSLEADTYLLGFFDAAMDSLGLEPPLRQIELKDAREISVPLAIPSVASIVSFNCRGAPDSSGLFLGTVRSAKDGFPLANASVRVRWSEMSISKQGVETHSPFVDVTTNAIGGFAVCGVPATSGSAIQVRVANNADSTGFFELGVPTTGLLRRDVYVGSATRIKAAPDSLNPGAEARAPYILRGAGQLKGTVVTRTGRPLEHARVTLSGSGVEFFSNADGAFFMQSVPSGTYMLEARAIGYLSEERVVDVVEHEIKGAKIVMDNQNTFLDTVRVMGVRPGFGFEGFAKRRNSGVGRFLDEAQIRDINPLAIVDVFRGMPGLHLTIGSQTGDSRTGYQVEMSGGGDGINLRCVPNIFLDRVRFFGGLADIDQLFKARDLRAVEVYNSSITTPGEFYSANACGTIVLWTKSDFTRHKL